MNQLFQSNNTGVQPFNMNKLSYEANIIANEDPLIPDDTSFDLNTV